MTSHVSVLGANMDEFAKTEARNYLSAAGFFLIGGFYLLSLLNRLMSSAPTDTNEVINITLGVGLLLVATLLIVLRKRDMIAILFILMGFWQVFFAYTTFGLWNNVIDGFILLAALVMLTSKDKQKWMVFLVPLLVSVVGIISTVSNYNLKIFVISHAIVAVLCLYYSFACATERVRLPGAKFLTADESTDFKASGSALGYMLFAFITGGYVIHYLLGEAVLPLEQFVPLELLCGFLLGFVAVLLFTVGQMRFTPVMFLLIALINVLSMFSTGMMFIGLGVLMLIIGLFAILRKESRVIPGIMLLIYGCSWFFSAYIVGTSVSLPVVSVIVNGLPCLIAIYLAFVVYSQRKLPKF